MSCPTCSDRGRVWDGPQGDTKRCPDCAVWQVWMVSAIGSDAFAGWRENEGITRREAEAIASKISPLWRCEIRRYVREAV